MTHPKHDKIKEMLTSGSTVREICKTLKVTPNAVVKIRAECVNELPVKPKPVVKPASVPRVPKVAIYGRVPAAIYSKFAAEMKRRGFTVSELLRHILSERYPFTDMDRLNEFEIQARCSCPESERIKNCNSNRDRDELVCGACGRVDSGGMDV